jgi:hypothetical protein
VLSPSQVFQMMGIKPFVANAPELKTKTEADTSEAPKGAGGAGHSHQRHYD